MLHQLWNIFQSYSLTSISEDITLVLTTIISHLDYHYSLWTCIVLFTLIHLQSFIFSYNDPLKTEIWSHHWPVLKILQYPYTGLQGPVQTGTLSHGSPPSSLRSSHTSLLSVTWILQVLLATPSLCKLLCVS